ncbi:hypothetical protein OUZ56_029937 [Daphnia magna]|uniref:Regulatory protein zeste n=1 Tax=Daphnia magna TaxID=35525 RepID=A0ABR0B875_9CRUS|nr:hypothetical protein OUZ56_029937 [Daphnia magna]
MSDSESNSSSNSDFSSGASSTADFLNYVISKFIATVTKKRLQKAWEEVLEEINLSCSHDKPKNGAEMKKKRNNLKNAAKLNIAQHKKSLTDTGGYSYKFFSAVQTLAPDSSENDIEVGDIKRDISNKNCNHTSTELCCWYNSNTSTQHLAIEIIVFRHQALHTFVHHLTIIILIGASKHFLTARFDFLVAVMNARNMRNDPMLDSEIPVDLFALRKEPLNSI